MSVETLAVETRGLHVAYGRNVVLHAVDFVVQQRVIMGVVGPNGAGKSTLLKAILGIIPRVDGEVRLLGASETKNQKLVGYIPQRSVIDWDFPITVRDLVTMGCYGRLGWIKRPGARERNEATSALEKLEILDLQHRQIGELSGGQQQRAFLARALMQDAPIYFLDEPFTGIDITTEKIMLKLMRELRDAGKTFVVVHHDLNSASKYMDSITLLNRTVVASGPLAETLNRENVEAAYGGSIGL